MSRGSAEPDPDLELVEALAGGDDAALDGLLARYEQPVFHFICRHVGNEADAREIAQEVFVRLYFNVAKFKPAAKFSTWLHQIALNLCRDHLKSRRTRQAAVTESLSAREDDAEHPARQFAVEKGTPSDEAVARERMAALDAGMDALPPDLRIALVMTALEQRSHRECADLLETTPKAIETRVHRARKQLIEWLAKAGFVFLLAGSLR
ncbi:MAG: RNA polymerase sigma factor [Chthoniobacteraceae bacterium]